MMHLRPPLGAVEFDAVISYSPKDEVFAAGLEFEFDRFQPAAAMALRQGHEGAFAA